MNAAHRVALVWRRLWALHPPVACVVRATPTACLQTLVTAARPSQDRLHLRDLFHEGRRYHIEPRADGFRMTSTTRPLWGNRHSRTRVAAILSGTLSSVQSDDAITSVRLSWRISLPYAISACFAPAFISAILVSMPWGARVIVPLIAALFVLSWIGHGLNAALQVNEMVFFVQKALDDLPPAEVAELSASVPHVVQAADFYAAWQKFYESMSEPEG
jgi:hypothetical protein